MKNAMRKLCAVLVFGSLMSSCENESKAPVTLLSLMINQVIASNRLQTLDIGTHSLSPENSKFINSERNSVWIPFNDNDSRRGIIAFFSKTNELTGVSYYETISNTPTDLVYSELKSGSFVGSFIFRTEIGTLQVDIDRFKIISKVTQRSANRTSLVGCQGLSEPGGALDCAGARLTNMNWFDSAICYAAFIPCMAQMVFSCILDKCVVSPPSV